MHFHKYTCPDVIHMRKVRRNTAIAYTIVYAAFCAVAYVWSVSVEKDSTTEVPVTDDEV